MAVKKARTKKTTARPRRVPKAEPAATLEIPPALQDFLDHTATPRGFVNRRPLAPGDLRRRLIDLNVRPTVPLDRLVGSVNRIKPDAGVALEKRPEDIRASIRALKPQLRTQRLIVRDTATHRKRHQAVLLAVGVDRRHAVTALFSGHLIQSIQ